MTTDPSFKVFNTLTGKLEPFLPLDPAGKQVRLYVCGPTVYDDAHLGHARCYITWDVLYRFLKFLGYDVRYVRNVTDVDDKILHRAAERGESPEALAERNYERFTADMCALNVLPPDVEPRATHHVRDMLAAIQTLMAQGQAYELPSGDVYFRVSAKGDYGKLKFQTADAAQLKKQLDDLQAGARVDVEPGKESALDFALWKAIPAAEREAAYGFDPAAWGFPLVKGRPGWHIECSAMNFAAFESAQIDIHAGGADLIFPHHENEIAQSEAWHNLPGDSENTRFAKYWLHNGFVNVSGEKMSKSLGNFSTVNKLLTRYDANTIRYFLLTNGYRMPVDFNDAALQGAADWSEKTTRKLSRLCQDTKGEPFAWRDRKGLSLAALQAAGYFQGEQPTRFVQALQEDLNTAKALGVFNSFLKSLHAASGPHEIANACLMLHQLGFQMRSVVDGWETGSGQAEASADGALSALPTLVVRRKQAKADKNWAEADAVRAQITALGLKILDNKDGTTSVEKDGREILRV